MELACDGQMTSLKKYPNIYFHISFNKIEIKFDKISNNLNENLIFTNGRLTLNQTITGTTSMEFLVQGLMVL